MESENIEIIIDKISKAVKVFTLPLISNMSEINKDPYLILIATVLSLRTRDTTTEEVSKKLFKIADEPYSMLKFDTGKLEKIIYPVGFYRVKAKQILKISRIIVEKYKGQVPDSLDELLALPGVGRKTANLVLIEGFNKDGICVDIHVHRISNRLGYINTKNPTETEMKLREILPKKFWKIYNNILVAYGQNLCTPVSPKCSICSVFNYCDRRGVLKYR